MLEENRVQGGGLPPENLFLRPAAAPAERGSRGIVDSRDPQDILHIDGFSPKDAEPCSPREQERLVYACVELVVPGNGEFPESGADHPEGFRQTLEVVDLRVDQVPRGNEDVGVCTADNLGYRLSPPVTHDQAEVDVGDLRDPHEGGGCGELVGDKPHPLDV
jgi:hypothetical protein